MESTLFGHKRGAFTGAHADHPGAFTVAHGGGSLDRLLAYTWPGNVRELRNVIARAAALAAPNAKFAEMPIALRADAGGAPEPLARTDVPYHDAKDALLARFDRGY